MIRQRAHVLTLIALFWTMISIGAIAGGIDSWNHGNHGLSGMSFPFVILLIHATIIYFTIHLWRTETPVKTNDEGFIIDDLLDIEPNQIDLAKEWERLKRVILFDIALWLSSMIAAWRNRIKGLIALGIFLGIIFLLHIAFEITRYWILANRLKRSAK